MNNYRKLTHAAFKQSYGFGKIVTLKSLCKSCGYHYNILQGFGQRLKTIGLTYDNLRK